MRRFNRVVAVLMCNWWMDYYKQDPTETVLERIAYWAREAAKNA